jgi:hypothetical protein
MKKNAANDRCGPFKTAEDRSRSIAGRDQVLMTEPYEPLLACKVGENKRLAPVLRHAHRHRHQFLGAARSSASSTAALSDGGVFLAPKALREALSAASPAAASTAR